MVAMKILLPLLISTVSLALVQADVRLLCAVWRHGDRAPGELPYPNDKYDESYWPRKWDQLTNLGIEQTVQLGEWLRKRYGGEKHSISDVLKKFNRKKVYIRSSDSERAIESAQGVAAGLFLPHGDLVWDEDNNYHLKYWQPTPIHTNGDGYDPLLRPSKIPCPEYDRLEKRDMTQLSAHVDSQYSTMFAAISNATGLDVSINNIGDLYDITRELNHGMKQDDWVYQVYNGSSVLSHIRELKRISNNAEFDTKPKSTLGGGYLVNNWLDEMEKASKGGYKRRANLYSSHDGTVSALLAALGVDNGQLVPYASCVLAELHDDATVQLWYRNGTRLDEPFPLVVPGCVHKCPLTKLATLLEDVRIRSLDQLRQKCNVPANA